MNELQQLGVPWFVDDRGMARQLGEDRAYSGGASVLLFLREGTRRVRRRLAPTGWPSPTG